MKVPGSADKWVADTLVTMFKDNKGAGDKISADRLRRVKLIARGGWQK